MSAMKRALDFAQRHQVAFGIGAISAGALFWIWRRSAPSPDASLGGAGDGTQGWGTLDTSGAGDGSPIIFGGGGIGPSTGYSAGPMPAAIAPASSDLGVTQTGLAAALAPLQNAIAALSLPPAPAPAAIAPAAAAAPPPAPAGLMTTPAPAAPAAKAPALVHSAPKSLALHTSPNFSLPPAFAKFVGGQGARNPTPAHPAVAPVYHPPAPPVFQYHPPSLPVFQHPLIQPPAPKPAQPKTPLPTALLQLFRPAAPAATAEQQRKKVQFAGAVASGRR